MNHTVWLMLVSVLCVAIAAWIFTFFRQPEKHQSRSMQLDGLRGVLACAVIAHHAYYNFTWREGGVWGANGNVLITNLGAVSVSLFFLMSAYLHLLKIRHSPEINWREFYIARAKRIYPLYVVIFVLVAAITAYFRPVNANNIGEFMKFSLEWLLFQNASFAGFQSHLAIAGVQWTLVYEWCVYAIMPLIHMIYHRKICFQPAAWIAIVGAWWIFEHSIGKFYWLFVLALPAVVLAKPIQTMLNKFPYIIHMIMIPLTVYIFGYTIGYSWEQRIALTVWFMFVAHGYSFANLLNLYGLRKLGDISYGIYLIHGLVLFMWFGVWKMFDFGQGNFVGYVWQLPLVFAVAIGLAQLSLRYIETPFVRKK